MLTHIRSPRNKMESNYHKGKEKKKKRKKKLGAQFFSVQLYLNQHSYPSFSFKKSVAQSLSWGHGFETK